MKKIYTMMIACLFFAGYNDAFAQYGTDVKILDRPSSREGNVSMDIAFNGWVYTTFTVDSYYLVRMSRDNGDTWTTIDSFFNAGGTYDFVKLTVAGNDTNSLFVFLAGVAHTIASGDRTIFVDKYNGLTGAYVSTGYFTTYNGQAIRALDITTDYKNPSANSSPYAIALLYGLANSYDSLFLVVSVDGGSNYGQKTPVASTGGYIRDVSIAYGVSPTWSNGRLFMIWTQYSSSSTSIGSLYYSYTGTAINDAPTPAFNLDSIYNPGVIRHPKISCSQKADNDSGGITVAVAYERAFNGGPDMDVWLLYNMGAPYGTNWEYKTIDNSSRITVEPAISFDSAYNNFLITYFDSTMNQLPYVVEHYNIENSAPINLIADYADDTTVLVTPYPVVCINPVLKRVGFAWSATPALGNNQAMFDAEYRLQMPVITSLNPDTVLAGNTAFTLTVNGSKFVNSSGVLWGSTPLTTTYVNENQLTAPVTAGMVATAGTVQVKVSTPTTTGGGGVSNSLTFYIQGTSGINQLGGLGSVTIFPNPASDQMNITYDLEESTDVEISLYDLNGNMVKQLSHSTGLAGKGIIQADISNVAQGMYEVVLQTANSRDAQKISILR